MPTATHNHCLNILKELYGAGDPLWYDVVGAKEELIERLKALSPVEKALLGIEEEE